MDDSSHSRALNGGLVQSTPASSSVNNNPMTYSSTSNVAELSTSTSTRPTGPRYSSSSTQQQANRRHKVRPVIYKSTNLAIAAPELVALTTPEAVSANQAIRNASRIAESVRDSYRACKNDPQNLGDAIVGNDDECNAKKYERRLKMNRQSAAASRVRREAYTKALEAELVNMESSYKKLLTLLEVERQRHRHNSHPSHLQPTDHSLTSDEQLDQLDQYFPVASSDVVSNPPPSAIDATTSIPGIPDVSFPVEPVGPDDHVQSLAVDSVQSPSPDVHITTSQPSDSVVDNSTNVLKTEDMLGFEDSVFAAQLHFPPDVLYSLGQPLYLPVPDAFPDLSDGPLGDGPSTSALFDEPDL